MNRTDELTESDGARSNSARRIQDAWRRHISRKHEGFIRSPNRSAQLVLSSEARWEDALRHAETHVQAQSYPC